MDDSISLNRLTTEILGACLSREAVTADHREELQAFLNAADCDLIQMQFIELAARLQTGRIFPTLRDLEAFIGTGKLRCGQCRRRHTSLHPVFHCRLACSRSDRRYREVEAIGADTLKES